MHVYSQEMPVARRWVQNLYLVLASLILLGIFLQGFLIGASLFGGAAWGRDAHSFMGLVLLILSLLLPLAGLLARLPGRITILSAVLFVLTLIQVTLAGLSRSAPFLAALHPANAMLMFGLTLFLIIQGWRVMQTGKGGSMMKQPQTMPAFIRDKEVRQARPLEINFATGGYILYALISAGVLTLFILNRGAIANAVRTMNPGFSQSQVDASVTSIQMIVVGAHIFFGVCFACFAFLIHTGKNWVRVASSIVVGLAILQTIYEWSSPTDVPAVLPPGDRLYAVFVQILMLLLILAGVALQWFPQSSRNFFTAKERRSPDLPNAGNN